MVDMETAEWLTWRRRVVDMETAECVDMEAEG